MIPKHLTTAAAVASATLLSANTVSGFLIPPELSDTDIAFAQEVASDLNPDGTNGLDPITASASQHQLVELACPGCPVLIKDRHHNAHHPKILTDKPNHLELDFKIDHTGGDRLLVNGFELFPNADPLRAELWAGQVLEGDGHVRTGKVEDMHRDDDDNHSDSDNEKDEKKHHENKKHRKHRNRKPKTMPQNLGFGLRTSSSQPSAEQAAQEIIDLNLQILEVGNAFVQGIPAVEIKLLRDQTNNKLMIANIDTAAPNEDSKDGLPVPFMGVAPSQPEPECDNFLCKLLEGFREKVKEGKEAWAKKMKGGCHGGMGQSAAPPVEEEEEHREMPVIEIDIERIDFDGEDGTWEIVSAPVEKQEEEEEEKKIKDLLDEVPQQEDESLEHGGWHHGHHGGMNRYEHSWGQLMKSITAHVLLPVLVGIVAGVLVSFVGMAVGTLIVVLYRFFYRRGGSCKGRKCLRNGGAGCKRSSRRHGKDGAEAPVEEKASLLNAQEPETEAPPAYEDAKVAEEGEVRK